MASYLSVIRETFWPYGHCRLQFRQVNPVEIVQSFLPLLNLFHNLTFCNVAEKVRSKEGSGSFFSCKAVGTLISLNSTLMLRYTVGQLLEDLLTVSDSSWLICEGFWCCLAMWALQSLLQYESPIGRFLECCPWTKITQMQRLC